MLRFLGVLVVLFALIAALGYSRGWFHAESHDLPGNHSVEVDVNQHKIDQDKAAVQQKVQDLSHK